MATVEITDMGPIEHLAFEVPEGGGVVVLTGSNGTGKSLAIDTTKRILGGNERPPIRDGADKGEAEGWGARINIGSRITKAGRLEVESLEGRLDLAAFIDPGIDDPASADAKRIKSLLSLLEVRGKASLFTPSLVPTLVYDSLAVEASDDLVEMAGRVKRKLEGKAREYTERSEAHRNKAEGLLGGDTHQYDDAIERDAAKLQETLESALEQRSRLEQQARDRAERMAKREEAQAKLAELPQADVEGTRAALDAANQAHSTAHDALVTAKIRFNEASHALQLAEQAHVAEQKTAALRVSFEEILAGDLPDEVPAAELLGASAAVASAREAIELGVKAREYDQRTEQALKERREAEDAEKISQLHRDAAKGIDGVLSDVVAELEIGVFVKEGRLSVTTPRGATPVGELSHGERTKLALQLAVSRVGRGGVIPLPQEHWESLDPDNRQAVIEFAHESGVVVVTAEAANGELRAETY